MHHFYSHALICRQIWNKILTFSLSHFEIFLSFVFIVTFFRSLKGAVYVYLNEMKHCKRAIVLETHDFLDYWIYSYDRYIFRIVNIRVDVI